MSTAPALAKELYQLIGYINHLKSVRNDALVNELLQWLDEGGFDDFKTRLHTYLESRLTSKVPSKSATIKFCRNLVLSIGVCKPIDVLPETTVLQVKQTLSRGEHVDPNRIGIFPKYNRPTQVVRIKPFPDNDSILDLWRLHGEGDFAYEILPP